MGGLPLGRLFGIPIRVNFSFLLLMLLFLFSQGLPGVLLLGVVFLSVLLHELGHSLVARRMGVPILGIDLHFFGGAAKMGRMPDSPREEILIAAVGPAVSFALALSGYVLLLVTHYGGFGYFAWINLVLGAFNLLPALPMDGGRIFRAILTRRMGRMRATTVAVKVARVAAVGLGVLGLVWGNFFMVGLAVMLWFLAGAELRGAQMWQHVQGLGGGGWGPHGTIHDDGVEVLDRDGSPVGAARGAAAREAGEPPWRAERSAQHETARGLGFTVEELRSGDGRRWIIRDPQGRVIFMAQQPLRW